MRVLLTGSAGFIGFHTARRLLAEGIEVVGFDNFNPYYDATLKERRNQQLEGHDGFRLVRGDLTDPQALDRAFELLGSGDDTRVCHLAAQAGVRHSIEHPEDFVRDNLVGFNNVIERVRRREVGGLVYASTSSIYGDQDVERLHEELPTDRQASLYGVTKKANELQAGVYHRLYGLRSTGLRFFTVYGPWGRPDMALFLFTDAILHDRPIKVFGHGEMQRDFTYVDDITQGVAAALRRNYELEIINLGRGKTEQLMRYIEIIEQCCGKEAEKQFLPMQPGDMRRTSADTGKAQRLLEYAPSTDIDVGVPRFVDWYREYHGV
ncbi:MAG: NAD-dependent epimerase/dehydratase family protein [Acidobacteria bacterium]|nr:MAG: NAD-dependent epimerase/dehydratase family protein [Acidobacteriota bacterium]REK06264.1 MAG: NAD-dependent epimerase/dehydratase family protein [Acidobacteriota bacterium]